MDIYDATGRRKASIARVRLIPGKGDIKVNKRDIKDYFKRDSLTAHALSPVGHVDQDGKFDIFANVHGGGLSGQAGAMQLAVARALSKIDEELRISLRKTSFLTRDSRIVERKKCGQKGARARFQFSKR